MGLDMYLYARKYVSKHDYTNFKRESGVMPPINKEWESLASFSPKGLMDNAQDFGGISVSYPVGYWRKANAIHGWFVSELADGEDECQEIGVSRGHLLILQDSCKAVLAADKDEMAEEAADHTLEPTPGFFFGNPEIDEWYIESLKYTIDMIDNVLSIVPEDSPGFDFVYQASW
jgi:hypothetical protein